MSGYACPAMPSAYPFIYPLSDSIRSLAKSPVAAGFQGFGSALLIGGSIGPKILSKAMVWLQIPRREKK